MTQLVLDVIPKQPHPWWLVNPTSDLAPRRRCVCGNTCSVLAGIGEVACPACGVPLPPRTLPVGCVYCLRVFVPALHFRVSVCPGCGADLDGSAGTVDVEGPRDAVNVRGPGQKPSERY